MVRTPEKRGRRSATSPEEIAKVAVDLFRRNGYASTSIADIAGAVGIARRTYFTYFASKADAFWWDDESDLRRVETALAEAPVSELGPLQQVMDIALDSPVWLNQDREAARSRHRMIESNPELQIGSLRFQRRWAEVIAGHLRRRIDPNSSDLLPEVIAASLLSVASLVLVRWAYSESDEELRDLFHENIAHVRASFEDAVTQKLIR